MVDFFYYAVPKRPVDMDTSELLRELARAYDASSYAEEHGHGISTKETVRRRRCEDALVSLPGGIDLWNTEFGHLE